MKKAPILTIFLLFVVGLAVAVCLFLTVGPSKSSQSANEGDSSNSANTANVQKTEKPGADTSDTQKTDKLSERFKRYKAFLQDEISSETKSDGPMSLSDFCNVTVPGKPEAAISYALFDMTGDGQPELHVLTDISYSIHTIEDNQLITWFEGDRYCRPLNNGAILWAKGATGFHYGYYFLDGKGEMCLCVGFGCPPKGAKKGLYRYYFGTGGPNSPDDYDDINVSKKKWKKLTKPFLAMRSDKIIWKHITDLDFVEAGHKQSGKEELQEKVLSWYQNNHYMYEPNDEAQYSCLCDDTDVIYGKKCDLARLYYEGRNNMLFAIEEETGEIYWEYGDDVFIPVNRIKILDYLKYEKKAEQIKKKIKKKIFSNYKIKGKDLEYCDTIERENVKYFVFGKFRSSVVRPVFLVKAETEEVYEWDLSEDKLNKVS